MGGQRKDEAACERRTGKGFVSGRGKERLGVVVVVLGGQVCDRWQMLLVRMQAVWVGSIWRVYRTCSSCTSSTHTDITAQHNSARRLNRGMEHVCMCLLLCSRAVALLFQHHQIAKLETASF